jgi:hypothetical protein
MQVKALISSSSDSAQDDDAEAEDGHEGEGDE